MKGRPGIDLNVMARSITLKEGRTHSLNIGDVREVMRLMLDELAKVPASAVLFLLESRKDD